jgi:peroxiredoxin/predicted 2-oxoglutarate/Fe(II)-dependent dioxygenase YbiX
LLSPADETKIVKVQELPVMQQRQYINILPGDPAPWFTQRTSNNPQYHFSSAAGRYIVLCFFVTASDEQGKTAIKAALAHWRLFDDKRFCFFGVSLDPGDEKERRVEEKIPGFRYFWDFDGSISRLYGSIPRDTKTGDANVPVRRMWVVLDPTLRVMRVIPFAADGSDREQLFKYLAMLPMPAKFAGFELQAPILFLPNVFEPDFCDMLVGLYETHGGEESGFMREVNGKTVAVYDDKHKKRRDYTITDEKIIAQTRDRVRRRVAAEILKVHQFKVTRMERYIVCCYAAEDNAHFAAHRDNTTKGTAHRRFAVSINLNDDFEGGEVGFPEYGPRTFKPPKGGAVVFSCSLLHMVTPVTKGRRFAFLPFLYDEESAKLRQQNNEFLGEGVGRYQASEKLQDQPPAPSAAPKEDKPEPAP